MRKEKKMFKLSNELIEKIRAALCGKSLAPAGVVNYSGCFGCSDVCTSNCGNNCITSCSSGCGTSCAGKNSR